MSSEQIISRVTIYKADIALKEPFRIAIMNIAHAQNVFVLIETEQGLTGWGEASPFWRICGETRSTCLTVGCDLAMLLKGKDALAIEERIRDIEGYIDNNPTIRSAFDMALYDIAGKAAGLPLYRLLGGTKRDLVTDLTIGINEPDYMAESAARIAAAGFKSIKVKLGTTAEQDVARVRAIRERIGDAIPIRIDANQGWDFSTALAALTALEPFGIEYCEQPVAAWDYASLARLRGRTSIPIMADDGLRDHHDAFKLCRDECCDLLNIKLSKAGGIRNALSICAVAEAAGKGCMVGCMLESRLGVTAAAHFASARRIIRYFDLDSALLLAEDPIIGGITYEGDRVHLPDEPGIGADVDSEYLSGLEAFTV